MQKQLMNKSSPIITIIILNFNGATWLEKCLSSFANIKDHSMLDVVVVDNASTDNSRAVVKKFAKVQLLELPKNYGFAAGNNQALAKVTTPYAMLLNSDTEWLPNTDINLLLAPFQKNSKIGMVTPKLILDSGEIDHACHRGLPTPWNAAFYFSGLAKVLPNFRFVSGYTQSWQNTNQAHFIPACSGAAMLVSKPALEDVGLLDEDFFMYGEDLDWCARFGKKGWQIWFEPAVTLIHHKHKSGLSGIAKQTIKQTNQAFYEAMDLYFRKHFSHWPKTALLALRLVLATMRSRRR